MTEKSTSSGPSGSADPMDQFLQLASSSKKSASSIRTIVHQSLSHPRIFAGYGELRSLPNVSEALSGTPTGDSALRTLDLFAYGIYNDYETSDTGTYLTLTDAQLVKLRQLTVVTLVQRCADAPRDGQQGGTTTKMKKTKKKKNQTAAPGSVPYDLLKSQLGMMNKSVRELEDLLISCVYSNLISGKLDQNSMRFVVDPRGVASSTSGPPCLSRDIKLDDVPKMIASLEAFYAKGDALLKSLERIGKEAGEIRTGDADRWKTVEEKVKLVRTKAAGGGGSGGAGGNNKAGGAGPMLSDAEASAWVVAHAAAVGMDPAAAVAAADLSMLEGGGGGGAGGASGGQRLGGGSSSSAGSSLRRQTKRSRGGTSGAATGGESGSFGRY